MEICKEMIKLRKGLDEREIVWKDASETYGNDKIKALGIDLTIYRTQFTAHDVWFSVIYGHGTYGNTSGLEAIEDKELEEPFKIEVIWLKEGE